VSSTVAYIDSDLEDLENELNFKKFSVGTGLILREQFSSRSTSLTGDAHGYSFFINDDLTDTYFLYGECQVSGSEESVTLPGVKHARVLGVCLFDGWRKEVSVFQQSQWLAFPAIRFQFQKQRPECTTAGGAIWVKIDL